MKYEARNQQLRDTVKIPNRWFTFLPYLALPETLALGETWRLTRADLYEGPWPSAAFRTVAQALLAKHRLADGAVIPKKTLALYRGNVMPENQPNPGEVESLRRAVTFGVLSENPPWQPDADGWSTSRLTRLRSTLATSAALSFRSMPAG